jgi:hypothetical protein
MEKAKTAAKTVSKFTDVIEKECANPDILLSGIDSMIKDGFKGTHYLVKRKCDECEYFSEKVGPMGYHLLVCNILREYENMRKQTVSM